MLVRLRAALRERRLRLTDAARAATTPHWQWGHPDDWSDAEWDAYKREKARKARKAN